MLIILIGILISPRGGLFSYYESEEDYCESLRELASRCLDEGIMLMATQKIPSTTREVAQHVSQERS